LDDILIFSKNETEYIEYVRKVLEKLKQVRLLLKPEKCEFYKEEPTFLGFFVGKNGVRIDSTKIDAVLSWPPPKTVKEVQFFLEFANFY